MQMRIVASSIAGSWLDTSSRKTELSHTDLVELEHGELDLLLLVLVFLGGGVVLLLAFLGTTEQAEREVQARILEDSLGCKSRRVL